MKTTPSDVYILGIPAYCHGSGASLVRNAEIVAAAQEERSCLWSQWV
jgi:predicted NodU family carbamoyl transferase